MVEHVVDQPWKAEVAISRAASDREKPDTVSFILGGQDTEIPAQYLMPASEAIELVAEMFRCGGIPPQWNWELV
jgi:hypothetical protein